MGWAIELGRGLLRGGFLVLILADWMGWDGMGWGGIEQPFFFLVWRWGILIYMGEPGGMRKRREEEERRYWREQVRGTAVHLI